MPRTTQEALLDQLALVRIRSNRTYRLYQLLAEDLSRIEDMVRQLKDGDTEYNYDRPIEVAEQTTSTKDISDCELGQISLFLQRLLEDNRNILEQVSSQRAFLGNIKLEQEKVKIEINELRHNINAFIRISPGA